MTFLVTDAEDEKLAHPKLECHKAIKSKETRSSASSLGVGRNLSHDSAVIGGFVVRTSNLEGNSRW